MKMPNGNSNTNAHEGLVQLSEMETVSDFYELKGWGLSEIKVLNDFLNLSLTLKIK